MFFDWYGYSAQGIPGAFSSNAWQAFSVIDVILALICLVAVGTALMSAFGSSVAEDYPLGGVIAGLGALALVLILYRIIDAPGLKLPVIGAEADVSLQIGIFLGLIAAAGIVFGGYAALSEGAPSPRRRPGGRRPPAA
jgi:hypothetical protein